MVVNLFLVAWLFFPCPSGLWPWLRGFSRPCPHERPSVTPALATRWDLGAGVTLLPLAVNRVSQALPWDALCVSVNSPLERGA